jgi:hypothetical protein
VCTAGPPVVNGTVCAGSGSETSICCNGTCWNGCCGGDGAPGACLVFATSTIYNGDLGGLDGANAKCQERAAAGSRPGTYKAWLSVSNNTVPGGSPATGGFRQSGQPYLLTNGNPVASSWADLVNPATDLANPIDRTELGAQLAASEVAWTNTLPDGTAGGRFPPAACGIYTVVYDCANWASTAGLGDIGDVGEKDCRWTASTIAGCSNNPPRHLYCFQQA